MKARRHRVASTVLALVAVCASPLLAQDVSLRYQWKKGETLRYRVTQASTVNMSGVPGMGDMTVTTNIVQVIKMATEDVTADGKATVKATFESVRMELGTPMGNIAYDSASPSSVAPDPMTDALMKGLGALVGESVTLLTAPNGIVKVQGMSLLGEKLQKAMPQNGLGAGGIDSLMSDDSMLSMFQQSFASMPERAVKPGDGWKNDVKIANPMAPVAAAISYTLKAVDTAGGAQLARVALTSVLKPAGPPTPNAMLPMTLQVGDGTGDGEIVVNVRLGRLEKSVVRTTQPMTMGMQSPDGTALNFSMLTKSTTTVELVTEK